MVLVAVFAWLHVAQQPVYQPRRREARERNLVGRVLDTLPCFAHSRRPDERDRMRRRDTARGEVIAYADEDHARTHLRYVVIARRQHAGADRIAALSQFADT